MGDMVDMYREMKADKKMEKETRGAINLEKIRVWIEDGEENRRHLFIEYRGGGSIVLFRFPRKPKADFFPTTNKWRSRNKTYHGDASQFLKWYEEQ